MISFPREWETEPGQHHPLQNVAVASFHLFLSLSQPSWKLEVPGVPGNVSLWAGDHNTLPCPSEPLECVNYSARRAQLYEQRGQLLIDTVALKIQDINLNKD